jgi:DNA modification methylase
VHLLDSVADVPLEALELYPGNARRGDLSALADSLRVNGQYRPIVVDRDRMQVLAGNHTLMAARELGWPTIKASFVEGLSETEARKIVLADNRLSDLASYENSALAELLASLPDYDGTGFAAADVDALIASLAAQNEPTALTDPDDVPEAPERPQSQLGDIWSLGPHRLLVGDATADLSELMQGDLADLVLTDPPYNVDYEGGTGLKIQNDKLLQSDFANLLDLAFGKASQVAAAGASIYVFHSDSHRVTFQTSAESAGWTIRQNLVWVKNALVMGRQDYHWKHEPILYGWLAGSAHRWHGDRKQSTVVEWDKPSKSELHPTMKPVGLLAYLVSNSSQIGGIVLDPFAGSGSTLIACHQQHRVARLVELDPKYADVICRRYWEHTGEQPRNQRGEIFN